MSVQQWVATIVLIEVFFCIFIAALFEPLDPEDWLEAWGMLHLAFAGVAVVGGLFAIATGEWVIG